jgi:hypothetical protein
MMPALIRSLLIALALTPAAACASGGASHAASPTSSDRSVITASEIPAEGTESAYELIQRIRPEYLRSRPAQAYSGTSGLSAPPPALMVNGQRVGEVSDLRQVPATSLSLVRFYNIEEGKRKFGMQYGGGAIDISYKTR